MTVRSEQPLLCICYDHQNYIKCTAVVIGFLNTSYTVDESDGVANIQFGVIQGSLDRPVVVQFSTNAISAAGKLHRSTMCADAITFKELSLLIQTAVTTVALPD